MISLAISSIMAAEVYALDPVEGPFVAYVVSETARGRFVIHVLGSAAAKALAEHYTRGSVDLEVRAAVPVGDRTWATFAGALRQALDHVQAQDLGNWVQIKTREELQFVDASGERATLGAPVPKPAPPPAVTNPYAAPDSVFIEEIKGGGW